MRNLIISMILMMTFNSYASDIKNQGILEYEAIRFGELNAFVTICNDEIDSETLERASSLIRLMHKLSGQFYGTNGVNVFNLLSSSTQSSIEGLYDNGYISIDAAKCAINVDTLISLNKVSISTKIVK